MKKLLSITLVVLMALMILPSISFADTTYTEWTSTTTLPTKSGAYKLTNDVTITSNQTIGAWAGSSTAAINTTVTLDLNGHTVRFKDAYYYIQCTGSLIIEDSVGTGLMTNEGSSSTSGYVIYVKRDCQINGGTIENTLLSGYAVYITNDTQKATCTLNGGKIINSNTSGARAVNVNNNATFTMNGGKIESKAIGVDTPAIYGNESTSKIIISGGEIESKGTGIDAAKLPVEITGGTIEADSYALKTRYATINPAEGKEVNISAGEAVLKPYSTPSTGEGNQIMGGNFDAPQLKSGSENNVKVSGGLFTMDVEEYKAPGYRVNYPVFVDGVEMYEVKQNRPHITGDSLKEDDELLGEIEIGFTEEIQEKLEEIFEEEIDKNEKLEEALLEGKLVNIHVQVERLEEKDINEEELKAIKEAAKEEKFVKFYDITLAMTAKGTNGTEDLGTISELSNKLTFKVLVPEELVKEGRTFFMYRYHGGKVEKLTGELDEENYFTFESDKFSTYALAYEDKVDEPNAGGQGTAEQQPAEDKKEEKDETPKTGSIDVVLVASAIVAVVSVAGIVAVKKYTR